MRVASSNFCRRKYLTKRDIKNIDSIKDCGNAAAHWGQKVHEKAKQNQSLSINKKLNRNSDPFTFQSTVPPMNLSKFIVTEAKATKVLKKSISVLGFLASRV